MYLVISTYRYILQEAQEKYWEDFKEDNALHLLCELHIKHHFQWDVAQWYSTCLVRERPWVQFQNKTKHHFQI